MERPENNYIVSICKLLEVLGIKFTKFNLKKVVSSIPNPNSMFAISEALRKYRIDHVSLVVKELNIFESLGVPFIAHLDSNEFITILRNEGTEFSFFNGRRRYQKMDKTSLFEICSGFVLIPQGMSEYREPNMNRNRLFGLLEKFRIPFSLLFMFFLIAKFSYLNDLLFDVNKHIGISIVTYLYFLGVLVCSLLLRAAFDSKDPLVKMICNNSIGNSGCSSILQSSSAKVYGNISWSHLGFVYFLGAFLVLIFKAPGLGLLFTLSLLSLPFTAWSLYYQFRIAKAICILCCTILAIMWLTFFCLIFIFKREDFLLLPNLNVLLCYFVPIISLWIFDPIFEKLNISEAAINQLKVFKSNPSVFEVLQRATEDVQFQELDSLIRFGNCESSFQITIVTNPYCAPCSDAHHQIVELLDLYREKVCVNIIFAVSETNKEVNKAIKHLIDLFHDFSLSRFEFVLAKWYQQEIKDFDSFISKNPASNHDLYSNDIMASHLALVKRLKVNNTPTVYLNGRKISRLYTVSDLEYFIDD